jgi:hypothetical protein
VKKINQPRIKHKSFATMMFRAAGDDWFICAHNPNNKQGAYFLAEPICGTGTDKKKVIGYFVSGLERAGESEFRMRGLPRKFKDVETAAEWLEDALEDYEGDEFTGVSELPAAKPPAEAAKSNGKRPRANTAAGKNPLEDILDGAGVA